ncbi:ABC transporter substrate-binding protein [Desulfobacter sp.]|uniref:ABC transporter substrate-binding protein n=1 Tax=Desulfobacter sp. TaxID=2294 RepID=UPI003D0E651B
MNQKTNTKINVIIAGLMVLCMMLFSAVTPVFAGDRLNYRLKWQFNTSVAGDIIADTGGFFKKAGLDVFVKEGGAGKNAIKELELRYADFGVASADQVIRALERGADVVVLAQLFQVNPMQWIYRSDQPEIKTLSDLNGRYIGVTFGGNDETIMNTLLAKAGLTSGDVFISSVRSDFTPFLKKEVDMWPVYRNAQGVILEDKLAAEGERVKFFNPADYGIHFVANSVVTSGAMMKKHPDTVKAFITALLSAWEFAMDPANEVQVLAQIKKKDTFTRDDIRQKQLEATRPLIKPDKGTKIGIIDARAWRQTESIMVRTEQIMTPVDVVTCLAGPKKRKIP